jgi:hypothetical protein
MNQNNDKLARAIQAGIEGDATELAKQVSYIAGNSTLKALDLTKRVEFVAGGAGGIQAAGSAGVTAFKAIKDIRRGDPVCSGLCITSTSCELVAAACSVCPFIPYRARVYVAVKMVSTGCMKFRNLCAGEGC